QTVTSYRDGAIDFAALLSRVAATPGLRRLGFLSPHPADFDARLLGTIAEHPNIVRHLHLPLQSGSDVVLAAMRRSYRREAYLRLVELARRIVPHLALTTDLIVGFPGEGPREFSETLDLMRAVRFDGAFMFAYSPRPRTHAARYLRDDVPLEEKQARLRRVIALQEQHSLERHRRWVGRETDVLVEGAARRPPGHLFGRSADLKDTIFAPGDEPVPSTGQIVRVRITAASSHTLRGSLSAPPRG
ncbi:MAG: radical SAM protein, partial [Candidatus Eisenbacteria bacterium]|nr:radical SAM protein [Candidatus Eisenbacteria bacterium]